MTPFKNKEKYTELVSATVVDLKEYVHEKREKKGVNNKHATYKTVKTYTYAPIYEYQYNDNTYKVVSVNSANPSPYAKGQEVALRIDPNNPGDIYEDPLTNTVMGSIIMKAIGAILAVGGIVVLIVKIVRRRSDYY